MGPADPDRLKLQAGDRQLDRQDDLLVTGKSGMPHFWLWLPGGIATIRGVYVGAAFDVHYQEFARLVNFALLADADTGDDYAETAVEALKQFAVRTEHPELVNAPVVGTGHSRYSNAIFQFIDKLPERTIAGAPGGLEFVPDDDASARVPFLEWYGSNDTTQSTKHAANLEAVRARHGLYAIAPVWGGGHSWSYGTNIAHPWLYEAILRRLPSSSPSTGPVPLEPIDEAAGWLGSRQGWIQESDGRFKSITPGTFATVAPYASYQGDATKAVWLVDSYVAAVWRAYVTPDDTVKITSPNPQNSDNNAPVTLIEPGAPLTVQVEATGAQKVAIYDGDLDVGETTTAPFSVSAVALQPGVHALIALATMADGHIVASRPSAVYAMRVPCPTAPASKFPIHCVKRP